MLSKFLISIKLWIYCLCLSSSLERSGPVYFSYVCSSYTLRDSFKSSVGMVSLLWYSPLLPLFICEKFQTLLHHRSLLGVCFFLRKLIKILK